jgi:KDO2-lipid IV(A) lauroyltransferase
MLLYLTFRAASLLLRLLPLRVGYAIARAGGVLAYLAWPGGRRRCIDNMRHVAGGDERLARRYARRSFANYVVYLVDFLRFTATTPEEIKQRVVFDEWDTLQAHRSGNGIVFVTMHFGNWDLGAAILALSGFPIAVIADRFPNERLNRLVLGSREHLGMTIIPADRMGPGILRALRRNDVVAVLADIPAPERGIEVEFFGGTVAVSDGPARIALRMGSSVVVGALPRISPWTDRVAGVVAPVPFTPTGETEHDVRALTQAIFGHLEQVVRRYPDQWYIFRHLWVADAAQAAAPRTA